MDLSRLTAIIEQKAQEAKEKQADHKQTLSNIELRETIVKTVKTAVEYLEDKTSKTVVMNQLKDFATHKDAEKFNSSLTSLHDTLKTHKNTDTTPITDVLNSVLAEVKQIPKDHAEQQEQKFIDYSETLQSLIAKVEEVTKTIKARKTIVEAPVFNIDAPVVKVDAPNLKPIETGLKDVTKAVKAIPQPKEVDFKPTIDELKKQTRYLKDMYETPSGGGGGGSSSIAPFLVDGALPVSGAGSTAVDYSANDIEDAATSYFGKTNTTGAYLIQKVTATSVSYATVTNNGVVTTYTDAWTNRATLTYGRYDEAF